MSELHWILLLPQLPPSSSSLRVAVWRRLKAAGSVSVQGGAWLLPASSRNEQAARDALEYVKSNGGGGMIFRSSLDDPTAEETVIASFRSNADQEYREFIERCQGLLEEIDRESGLGKFTFAELDENEEELQKLTSWLRKIRARDFFGAAGTDAADSSLEACRKALGEFEKQVYLHEGLDAPAGDRDGQALP